MAYSQAGMLHPCLAKCWTSVIRCIDRRPFSFFPHCYRGCMQAEFGMHGLVPIPMHFLRFFRQTGRSAVHWCIPLLLVFVLPWGGLFSGSALAQPSLPATLGEPIDNLRTLSPDWSEQYRAPEHAAPDAAGSAEAGADKPVELSDEDVKANPQIAEIIINTALQQRDWPTLARVLPLYRQSFRHDAQMVSYVEGALLRQQGRQAEAIEQYRGMLARDAGLDYVRFDLAAMLFENREHREARELFADTVGNPLVDRNFQEMARQYLAQIVQRERVNKRLRLRLLHNYNVNQASDDRYLELGGWIFEKNAEFMPRSSAGLNYGLTLDQEWNLQGNHFLSWELSADGLHYSSAQEFNENAVSLNLAYRWQDARSWLYAGPVLELRWLDGKRYVNSHGVAAGHGRWLSPGWQATLHVRWMDKDYVDEALDDYDGHALSVVPGLLRVISPNTAVFGGLVWQRERVSVRTESFEQRGLNGGFSTQWDKGLNLSGNVQLAFRRHEGVHPLFAHQRRDRRLNAMLNIGHAGLNMAGFETKLGFQFEKVDSNIAELYSRTVRQWMLTAERRF
ncbi:surface lipoprotein assembly modifier [Thauera sp. Sel9]|uniref:surface lipoprotein assembly modifier n=1 Tax=Thauera sp. Sel9 TaxID=2974299 RepID=UPI0021E16CFF|nr:surface lipoprotein assembly modifier [Thauera sp. Sel9]MCV2217163.1 surface lipoprotein assembly modifier [Thauera sp. Sel9]